MASLEASATPSIATDITARGLSVCLYVWVSVTFIHSAKAFGRNEIPFGRDTCVVPSNTVLDRGPDPSREGEIVGWNPS